jgi:hypothetical protein
MQGVRQCLRRVFNVWSTLVLGKARKLATEECASLREKLGSTADSVWKMNKARLVQVAVRELSMDEAEAMKKRVPELQHLITTSRTKNPSRGKTCRPELLKRFNRLKHAELVIQMAARNLESPNPLGRLGYKNREAMISELVAYETAMLDNGDSIWAAADLSGEQLAGGAFSFQLCTGELSTGELSVAQLVAMVRNNAELQTALRISPGLFH